MRRIGSLSSLKGGISPIKKNGPPNTVHFLRGIDFRSDSSEVTINPLSAKISGGTVVDLPMDMDVAGDLLYAYGNTGRVYQVSTADVVTNEYTVSDSVGNGMGYLAEDKFLYLASNTSLSRRSTATTTGIYYPNFLENEGGAPTNTRSIDFEASSSQSATRADTASLSITGDITLETYVKPESLPTSGNTMALMSKWDESGTLRSYKLAFVPTSNFFGDGSDGALTISANTTEAPIDSACTGTSGAVALTATNGSFAAGQKILIHQSQGTGAGMKMLNTVVSYTAGTITLADALNGTYTTGAQVRVLKQYTNVTVNSGITYTAKAWNGTVGGILGFLANGTVTITGTISANGSDNSTVSGGAGVTSSIAGATGGGFRGGIGYISSSGSGSGDGGSGEGTTGVSVRQTTANGNGGGGGGSNIGGSSGGGGGGNGTAGTAGAGNDHPSNGYGGGTSGAADLTTMTFGGGGGGASYYSTIPANVASGASGGGALFIAGVTVTVTGSITANGGNGGLGSPDIGGGGSGGGGSILMMCQTAILGTALITATGGTPQTAGSTVTQSGGNGGVGRINLNYLTSYTGTTSPTLNTVQDNTLGSADGVALRFYVSSTGLNSETYTQNIDDPTGQWNRFSVAWDASESTAYFYKNGELLGTKIGALTAIHNNASIFGLATYVSSGSANTAFYDGLMDDARVWNDIRTATEIAFYNAQVLTGGEGNLVAYYKLDSSVVDSQTSALNSLTANNSPTYSTDIPFTGVTTRNDQDVAIAGSGQTYTLTTAVNEGATHRQTFAPTKEPLKSLALNISAVGTGNWTIVVHDELNRELATVTVANGTLTTGVYEFILPVSRPVLNADYHVHAYSTVADGTIATSVSSDMEGAYLRTYFQILVSDEYHPMEQFTNFLVIGNERYVAKLEAGSVYDPHRLTLPSGYRVRCFAFWHDYIAIGTWRGTAVTDVDSAKILFWDGTSDTYVEPLDVPQGAINAMFGRQGKLLISAGYRGQFLEYTGGEEAYPLFRIPLAEAADKIEIAPNALTMWQGVIQIGADLSTDSTTIHQGIYTWGRKEMTDPLSLGFDPLSLGDQTSSGVKVGSVIARGKKLYVGYENGGSFGIDVRDQDAAPYATATVELLNTDLQNVPDVKYPLTFRIDFLPLVSGQSVALKYKPDRAASWVPLQTQSTTGATEVAGSILKRVKEVQFAADYTTNGSQLTTINYAFDIDDPDKAQPLRYVK